MLCVYLASKSERRLQLLKQIGVNAKVIIPNISEEKKPKEPTLDYVNRMAVTKAKAGWSHADRRMNLPIIGADTIVVCDNRIIGKPNNKEDAIFILNQLSGCTHQVITAVAIINENKMKQFYVASDVTFKQLTEQDIENYWNTGEPSDKAGAYAIQGRAAMYITNLSGSYSAVVGLPLYETAELLREFNVLF